MHTSVEDWECEKTRRRNRGPAGQQDIRTSFHQGQTRVCLTPSCRYVRRVDKHRFSLGSFNIFLTTYICTYMIVQCMADCSYNGSIQAGQMCVTQSYLYIWVVSSRTMMHVTQSVFLIFELFQAGHRGMLLKAWCFFTGR